MSEFQFAVSTSVVAPEVAAERHRIASEIDPRAGYTSARMPDGPRSWGYGPNRGEPFDGNLARDVEAAWAASGVASTVEHGRRVGSVSTPPALSQRRTARSSS